MAILPLQTARVSDLLQASVANQSISSTQSQLLQVENELSTGKQINQPSDNPAAAATILALNQVLSQRTAYASNIQNAQSQLGSVGTALTSLNNLLLQAQNIASSDAGSTTTAQQRQADAQVVNSIITEVQNLANTNTNGVYIFGGQNGNDAPYVNGTGGIQFVGSGSVIQTEVDQNTLMPTQLSGANVFGAFSSRVTGSADLTPSVTAQTQLSDIGGADGEEFTGGTITLSNGTTQQTVDLTGAQTLGDVISDINSAGVGITATLSSTGIDLTAAPADNITVADSNGTAAEVLGIATGSGGAGVGNPVNGGALNPKVTLLTPISTLNGGAGIDSAGIIITNGSVSKTLTFPSGGDVESILNTINGAGLGVVASINSSGTGINVLNATQGATMTIGENGGTTATDLGIRTFSPTSTLAELNNGDGVSTATEGSSGDFTITSAAGTSFNVSIAGATTIQDVINDINSAAGTAGVNVTAGFATTGNGITLTDGTTGSGTLTVQAINASQAAADLGLTTQASGNTITGSDVDGVQTEGVFTDLQALAQALQTGDQDGITAAATALQNDYSNASTANGVVGAQVQALQDRTSELSTENIATQQLLSNIQDTNMTTAISQFQTLQTALQASLETTAQSQELTLLNFIAT
jgi:flagellar hook-associated protein 3 FlgL